MIRSTRVRSVAERRWLKVFRTLNEFQARLFAAEYAIRVKSNCERTVANGLDHRGYEQFLPSYQTRRSWSDRFTDIDAPLFQGYVFCRLNIQFAASDTANTVPHLSSGISAYQRRMSWGCHGSALQSHE